MKIKKILDLLDCDIKSFIDKVASMLNDSNYKIGIQLDLKVYRIMRQRSQKEFPINFNKYAVSDCCE